MNKKYIFIISVIIIIIDQIIKKLICDFIPIGYSKQFIGQVIKLSNVCNTGGAFSLGNKNIFLIIIINIILICFLICFLFKKYKEISNFNKFSSALIIGGGISNLADRIFRGYVVDYIDINNLFKYPIFNFADIGIVVGVCFIIINLSIQIVKEGKQKID